MSQAKVDKRKYEKKNRKKLEKQRKIRFAVKCVVAALIIGAIIGVPTGINIYRNMPRFVGDATLAAFVGNYIDESHADDVPDFEALMGSQEDGESDSDPAIDKAVKAIQEAVGDTEESTEE